jgi:hypothetical protein
MYRYSLFLLISVSTLLYPAIKFIHKNDPYATHQPVLYVMANNTTGPIIEFGCGEGSTDMLHEICKKNNRLLISIDDDFAWLSKFTTKYLGDGYSSDNSGWHKFFFVPGKTTENNNDPERWITFLDSFELLKTIKFDLCFIDQNPWLGRFETIKRIKGNSKYIIVHDFDYFAVNNVFGRMLKPLSNGNPGEFDFSDIFKYFQVYFPLTPWPAPTGPGTLVASETESAFPLIDFAQY